MQNFSVTNHDADMKLGLVIRPDRGIIETREVRKVEN